MTIDPAPLQGGGIQPDALGLAGIVVTPAGLLFQLRSSFQLLSNDVEGPTESVGAVGDEVASMSDSLSRIEGYLIGSGRDSGRPDLTEYGGEGGVRSGDRAQTARPWVSPQSAWWGAPESLGSPAGIEPIQPTEVLIHASPGEWVTARYSTVVESGADATDVRVSFDSDDVPDGLTSETVEETLTDTIEDGAFDLTVSEVIVGPVNHLPTDYEVQFELSSTDSTRVEQFVRAFAATLVRSSVDA